MNPRRLAIPLCFAVFGAYGSLAAQQTKVDELPGLGKPQRSGYIITVEGGEEGPKTVHYPENNRPRDPNRPVNNTPFPPPQPGRPMPPQPASPESAPSAATRGPVSLDKELEDEQVDPVVQKFMHREDNLAGRRFGKDSADTVDTGARFDRGAPVGFGRWGDAETRFDKSRAESLDTNSRFDTGERIERKNVTFDRLARERFANGDKQAEIPAWTDRFSREKNDKFSDVGPRNAFANKFVDGMSLLTRVSMQQINRNNFRRNHSDAAGELPVGVMSTGEVRPMTSAED